MGFACFATLFGQYTLTVEETATVATDGYVTYNFYVDMQDPTDRMSAVFGNDQTPLEISAPEGVFNTTYNSSWSASGLSAMFVGVFPEMADDTYATIGLESPASEGALGSEDPSLVEDSAQPISPFLLNNGATSLLASTLTGASYYVLNTAANGLPDENLQVKIMQITTPGTVNGIINFQVFPLGVGADQVQMTIPFAGAGTFNAVVLPEYGCMDELACNYDAEANEDDGSCVYAEEYHDCDGNCINDADDNGICDEEEVYGCTIAQACNYNPDATINDGSCDFVSCLALGCTDPTACNYDEEAQFEDGSCEYASMPYDCDGNCVNDNDGDGVCDENEEFGCTDMVACNYDELATDDDGSCDYAAAGYNCDGSCVNDADGDGVCDGDEVLGCNDVSACNYDATATENDGTCDFCSCSDAGTDGYGLEVDVVATHTTGALAGMTTYRLFITTPHADDFLSAVYGDAEEPLNVFSSTDFYQHQYGSVLGSDMLPEIYPTFPEMEFDSWVTIGLDQSPAAGEMAAQTIESTEFSWIAQFENGGAIDIDDTIGGSWFVLNPAATDNAYSDADQRILVAQLTTSGLPSGTINAQLFNHGDQEDVSRIALSFSGTSGTSASSCGCIDELACNYDELATDDDGSCTYPDEDYLDCDGECIEDADGDGICDINEVSGCMDELACNYNPDATDDEGCEYAEPNYDCNDVCINDADGDGVCDEDEVPGCTDAGACNYNADATDEDGSCEYETCQGCMDELACNYDEDATIAGECTYPDEDYLDCDGECLNDTDGDGVCDEEEVPGCTDDGACNYNADATDDDGSCEYTSCAGCTDPLACNYDEFATIDDDSCYYAEDYYDCNGDCINDTDGDGVCDEEEVDGCTDSEATNYNEDATEDDGSCCYLVITLSIDDPECYGEEGTVTATAEGGAGVVTFTLGDESNTTGVFNVEASDEGFEVIATDENGCTASLLGDVDQPDEIVLTVDTEPETLAGLGSGTATASGGTGDITITWYQDGEVVDPAALAAGTYTVEAEDENGCTVTEEVVVDLDGLEDIDPLAFNMFPNPTTGTFYLQLPQVNEDVVLTIVDGVGRTVYSEQLAVVQGNTEINLSSVAAGTYSVILSGDAGTSVRRLSIVR